MDDAQRGANATLTIDLPNQEIRGPDGGVVKFELDPFRKHCLLEGLDDIGLTLVEAPAIAAYETKARGRASLAVNPFSRCAGEEPAPGRRPGGGRLAAR